MIKNKNFLPSFFFSLLFFIPFFQILGPFIPDLIITFTVIYFFFIYFNNNVEKNTSYLFNDKFIKFYFIFLIFLFLSSVINFFLSENFDYENLKSFFSRSIFLFRFIIYPIALIYLYKNFKIKINRLLIYFFLITFLLVLFDTLYQYFAGEDIFGFTANERGGKAIGRLSGPFDDELIPGSYLSKYLFVTLLFIYMLGNSNIKIFFVIFMSILVILLTGERASFILSLFGCFIFFIIFKKHRVLALSSICIMFLLSFLILKENTVLKTRLINHTIFQLGISSNTWGGINKDGTNHYLSGIGRQKAKLIDSPYGAHWETAYRIWIDNKFIGIGLKQFRKKCADEKYSNIKSALRSVRCGTHPHNIYLEILSETGLIGLLLFLFFLFYLFKDIFINLKKNENIKYILICLVIFFWPISTHGSLFTNMNQIYFSFYITIYLLLRETDFLTTFK